jgi:predicted small lipoprotein YifL
MTSARRKRLGPVLSIARAASLAAALLAAASCGQTGPLTLPGPATPASTDPAAPTDAADTEEDQTEQDER